MLISFLRHGTGPARAASRYMLAEMDAGGTARAGVEVLRGNPDLVAEVADSLPFKHRYTSGVIAWAAGAMRRATGRSMRSSMISRSWPLPGWRRSGAAGRQSCTGMKMAAAMSTCWRPAAILRPAGPSTSHRRAG